MNEKVYSRSKLHFKAFYEGKLCCESYWLAGLDLNVVGESLEDSSTYLS